MYSVFSVVYFMHLNSRTFIEQIPLILKWVEHKISDVVGSSSQVASTTTFSENSRESPDIIKSIKEHCIRGVGLECGQ